MVPRKPKIIAALAVLAAGVCLALPWRRSEPLPDAAFPVAKETPRVGATVTTVNQTASSPAPLPTQSIGLSGPALPSPSPFVGVSLPTPASVTPPARLPFAPPALPGVHLLLPSEEVPSERIHIIDRGDSLEYLAKRYLGDEGRAVELFDLNRQVLDNPHLLPIGAELKIPLTPQPTTPTAAH